MFCRVENAEVLCLGLVAVTVFMLVMPLFRVSGGVLLQMAPPSIPSSALSKCLRQVFLNTNPLSVSDCCAIASFDHSSVNFVMFH